VRLAGRTTPLSAMSLTPRSAPRRLARTDHWHSVLSALVSASIRAIDEAKSLGKIHFVAHSRGTDVLASAQQEPVFHVLIAPGVTTAYGTFET
jgi:fermentation-respiration switch protein FrsA (DUF1100 family)